MGCNARKTNKQQTNILVHLSQTEIAKCFMSLFHSQKQNHEQDSPFIYTFNLFYKYYLYVTLKILVYMFGSVKMFLFKYWEVYLK
jgi:hypothetical protein